MSSTFDGSKVSGLANAVDEQIENVQSDISTFMSETCFRFLKDDETYNIKNQIEQLEFDLSNTGGVFNDQVIIAITLLVPTYNYDPDTNSWGTERVYSEIQKIVPFDFSPTTELLEADVSLVFGQYICEFSMNMVEPEGTSSIVSFICSEPVWRKVSFT